MDSFRIYLKVDKIDSLLPGYRSLMFTFQKKAVIRLTDIENPSNLFKILFILALTALFLCRRIIYHKQDKKGVESLICT